MIPKTCFSWFQVLLLLLTLSIGNNGAAQNTFFTNLYGGGPIFNPALVGHQGSTVLTTKYKNEWNIAGEEIPAYQSSLLTYEESMPCTPLDYGLSVLLDQEGEGLLQTLEIGAQFAGAFPLGDAVNFRPGLGFQIGRKRIDFSKLVFSDQLDPKFGEIFPTEFSPPGDNSSLWYLMPSIGFSLRAILFQDRFRRRAPTLHVGAALHNTFTSNRSDRILGDDNSLLQTEYILPRHLTAFLHFEIIPKVNNSQSYMSLKLIGYYRRQVNIDAITAGLRWGMSPHVGLSVLMDFNETQLVGTNTNWMTFMIDMNNFFDGGNKRFDIGLAYSHNLSGLRNEVSGIFELTLACHFGRSLVCGENGIYRKSKRSIPCLTSSLSAKKQKIYDNIWYE